ncbi:fimbrial protein [Salmonella enterica]|nr:fimbrial protein [Salmonella enterica]EKG3676773.1 fimbrial protein [Salmonella enterica]
MNKVTYVLLKMIKREGWSAFMLFRRMKRMPLWLLMVCTLMGPEYATADECKSLTGPVNLVLPPSVSFPPGGHLDASESNPVPLFTGSTYSIQYECTNNTSSPRQVRLARLGDFTPLLLALQTAGMKLTLIIKDSTGGSVTWVPTLNTPDTIRFGSLYTGTVERRVSITPELSLIKPPTAGFSVVPSLTAFEIISGLTSGSRFDGPTITTSAVRIQYVPTCFVRTSLGTNNVNFGPVLTTDVNGSLSRTIPFNVTADVNKSCNDGTLGNLQEAYNKYYLDLPLKVSFMLNNGGDVAIDRKSILLYTDKDNKHLKNGLQLKINAPDGEPVTFNEASLPVNKFGDFQGGGDMWRVSNTYNAVLSSTGDPVLTGKYNAQVLVKVDYY